MCWPKGKDIYFMYYEVVKYVYIYIYINILYIYIICVLAWHLEGFLNTCWAWTEHIFNYTWFNTDVRRQVTMDTSHNIVPANMHVL